MVSRFLSLSLSLRIWFIYIQVPSAHRRWEDDSRVWISSSLLPKIYRNAPNAEAPSRTNCRIEEPIIRNGIYWLTRIFQLFFFSSGFFHYAMYGRLISNVIKCIYTSSTFRFESIDSMSRCFYSTSSSRQHSKAKFLESFIECISTKPFHIRTASRWAHKMLSRIIWKEKGCRLIIICGYPI